MCQGQLSALLPILSNFVLTITLEEGIIIPI